MQLINTLCKNDKLRSYYWNMLSTLLTALQSVIILMILTRNIDLNACGIFSLAFANANLFLMIGKFGMRNYQVSDCNKLYSFDEYLFSRVITSVAMIILLITYLVINKYSNSYSITKTLVILIVCFSKLIDSFEDVFHGFYQREGRLDLAGRSMSIRLIFSLITFYVSVLLTKNLLKSVLTMSICSLFLFLCLTIQCNNKLQLQLCIKNINKQKLIDLFLDCAPIFFSSFLALYISNAPKYAIDKYLSEQIQACYGFLSMPVFVIGLVNNFFFNPIVSDTAELWNNGKKRDFLKMLYKQMFILSIIITFCYFFTYICGIQLLSIIYNTDLHIYKTELLILMLGGGASALAGHLLTILTIMRMQWSLVIGYFFSSVIACILSKLIIISYGILGASIVFLLSMVITCIIFVIFLIWGVRRKKNE